MVSHKESLFSIHRNGARNSHMNINAYAFVNGTMREKVHLDPTKLYKNRSYIPTSFPGNYTNEWVRKYGDLKPHYKNKDYLPVLVDWVTGPLLVNQDLDKDKQRIARSYAEFVKRVVKRAVLATMRLIKDVRPKTRDEFYDDLVHDTWSKREYFILHMILTSVRPYGTGDSSNEINKWIGFIQKRMNVLGLESGRVLNKATADHVKNILALIPVQPHPLFKGLLLPFAVEAELADMARKNDGTVNWKALLTLYESSSRVGNATVRNGDVFFSATNNLRNNLDFLQNLFVTRGNARRPHRTISDDSAYEGSPTPFRTNSAYINNNNK